MLIPTRLVANPSRLRSLHHSINQTSSLAAHQQLVTPALNQPKPRYPDPSRPECLSTHVLPILWQTRDSLSLVLTRRILTKVLTPLQGQFAIQGEPHTLPGLGYLSEHILAPLWQNQDYCFTAIYTVTLMKLYVQLHE